MNDGELGFGFVRKGTARRKFLSSLLRIVCNGARTRIWHNSLRSKDTGEFGQFWHVCGGSQKDVEVDFAGVDFGSDFVRENGDFDDFAGGVRELELAFDTCFSGVDVEFNGFELGSFTKLGKKFDTVFYGVELVLFELFDHSFVLARSTLGFGSFFGFNSGDCFAVARNDGVVGSDFGGNWSRVGVVNSANGVDVFLFDAFNSH